MSHANRSHAAVVALFVVLLLCTGCSSPWQRTYEPATAEEFEPTERVIIREVPWNRLNGTLSEIATAQAVSDVHPDEWTADQLADEHTRLVTALQLSENPASVVILGRGVFRSTSNIDLFDGSLSEFARSIGADYAIWSTTYLGKAQTVEQESVIRHGYTYRRFRHRDGRIDYDYIPYHETMFVPIVVERDEHAWMVYYVRITD